MIINPYIFGGFDQDAQAFITAANITNTTQQNAINTLVVSLKGYGIWTKMKAIYPFVGGTASTHKWNLKDPRDLDAAFRLVFNGGYTHTANGILPNGINAFCDTKLNQSANLTPNNNHISVYSRTDLNAAVIDSGVTNNNTHSFSSLRLRIGGNFGFENGSQFINISNPNSLGFFLGSSTSSTNAKSYKNGVLFGTNITLQSRTMFNANIYLSANNWAPSTPISFSSRNLAFATIGDGLTDTEAANLYTSVQNYQVALSRNV